MILSLILDVNNEIDVIIWNITMNYFKNEKNAIYLQENSSILTKSL